MANTVLRLGFPVHTFSGLRINRCELQRKDPTWVQGMLSDNALVMLFDDENVLTGGGSGAKPTSGADATCLLPLGATRATFPFLELHHDVILLGETPAAGDVAALAVGAKRIATSTLPAEHKEQLRAQGWEWTSVRKLLTTASPELAPLVGYGKSLSQWHTTAKFCGLCGAKTVMAEGGACRACTACDNKAYPRINPCAIMLVLDGKGKCLLGKIKGRPMYSTLAGYLSHGESVEETVAREVEEESGVKVARVFYHSSQSWPFPFQLMLGYHAVADPNHSSIRIDPHELDDAQWFSKDDARSALANQNEFLMVPPAYSIAHQLIKAWVDGRVGDDGTLPH